MAWQKLHSRCSWAPWIMVWAHLSKSRTAPRFGSAKYPAILSKAIEEKGPNKTSRHPLNPRSPKHVQSVQSLQRCEFSMAASPASSKSPASFNANGLGKRAMIRCRFLPCFFLLTKRSLSRQTKSAAQLAIHTVQQCEGKTKGTKWRHQKGQSRKSLSHELRQETSCRRPENSSHLPDTKLLKRPSRTKFKQRQG